MPDPPADLADVPDAEPVLEPIRSGGPNKPYEVLGGSYKPETRDVPLRETGLASWYGRKFQGKPTASGELYNMYAMTAAHKTMPLPSYARVRNLKNGREIIVRINDRGPFHPDRVIDLSYTAALKLDLLRGVAVVEVERITFEDIRTGAWRRGSGPGQPPMALADATNTATNAAGVASPPPAASAPAVAPSAAAAAITKPVVQAPAAPDAEAARPFASTASPAAAPAADTMPPGDVSPGDGGAAEAPIANAAPARAATVAARGFWVQLGAFRERGGAESFHQRVAAELDWLTPLLAVFQEVPLFRLQAGPYRSRDDAQAAAQRVRTALQLVPVIVERR